MSAPLASPSADIGRLIALAQNSSASGRGELYTAIATAMTARTGATSPAEDRLLAEVMGRLTHQVEMSVRLALADRLAERPDAPHELILMLANDAIDVARPVLTHSTVLTEDDLAGLISASSTVHHEVIAGRPDVSLRLSAMLSQSPADHVVLALLKNHRAQIAETSLQEIAARSRTAAELQSALAVRPDLSQDLAQRLCGFVSQELAAFIGQRFNIDAAALSPALNMAAADAHAQLTQATGAQRMVEKLFLSGQLKPAFAVRALTQGQLDVFEYAAARLIGAPPDAFAALMRKGDAAFLALVCQAIGIDRSAFATLFQKLESARGGQGILGSDERRRADEIFQGISRNAAREALQRRAA